MKHVRAVIPPGKWRSELSFQLLISFYEHRARLYEPVAEDPSKAIKFIEKLGTPARASRKARSESRRNCRASAMSTPPHHQAGRVCISELTRRTTLSAFISPEPTGSWRMTNRFGIYLCRGTCRSEEVVGRAIGLSRRSLIAAGRVLPMLLVRLGLGEITHFFLASWPPGRLPRLENRRLGFEPLRQREQRSFDTGALAHRPTATLSCFDSQQFW